MAVRGKRKLGLLLVAAALAGCGGGGGGAEPSAEVVLEAANGSGITGTATVTRASPSSVTVEIAVDGLTGRSPVEIVAGECGGFTAPTVERKLPPLVDGRLTTTVPLSFDEVTGTGYTIAVKRGADYVACGSIVP